MVYLVLGFYLDVRSWSLRFNPTRPCFVPVLPQPLELAAVARRVANYSFDAYDSIWIEDLQNGRILIRENASRFVPGASSYGDVLCPLGPKGAVVILPCPPDDHPRDSRYSLKDYGLFKQGGQDLFYLVLFENFFPHMKDSATQVYMLQDGIWCMHASDTAQHLFRTWRVRPLLVDNKIYIAGAQADILVLDLRTSSFAKIQLPEGVDVEYNRTNTMFSRTDDDSRVYLFHVKEFQLSIWLHNGDNWLLVDAICLREMVANLRMSDHTVWIDFTDAVKIKQAGENAESACLQIGRSVLYLDIKCRTMHRVYEMAEDDQQYLADIYPFLMIWPPTFPVLKDDPARQGSSVEIGGPETLDT